MARRYRVAFALGCLIVFALGTYNAVSMERISESNKKSYFGTIDKSIVGSKLLMHTRIPRVKSLQPSENTNVLIAMGYLLEDLLKEEAMPTKEFIKANCVMITACQETNSTDVVYLPIRYNSTNTLISMSGCGEEEYFGLCCDIEPKDFQEGETYENRVVSIMEKYFKPEVIIRMKPLVYHAEKAFCEFKNEKTVDLRGVISSSEFSVTANAARVLRILPAALQPQLNDCFKRLNSAPPPLKPRKANSAKHARH